ncbi:MAG: flavodoxin family protein [Actinobacteria bacterium]|nr:flavodoxin family protein [Actinomycetota bacterium]MCB8998277.1 flavodoxin family protein [Actinomycetota bacterium]MCB9415545.1 flavodoxin family protein [Actinomycetota bacterium]HRY11172.1 NAD(P)H-dependent oxidoreductase [Candidatus Nanopelagicales bacterium]
MARLLIVHHTPSPAVRQLLEAAVAGARVPELADVDVQAEPALSATASDVLAADAILMITPANIGYMSGALKHFFDTIYYPCMDATRGMPWGLVVHGNDDTAGAVSSVTKLAGALTWRQVVQVVSVVGQPDSATLDTVRDVGATVCAAAVRT